MFKKFLLRFGSLVFLLLIPKLTQAVCPACTVAVGAGVGLCRYLTIDDLISGTWIGGLITSLIIWTINWLDKKKIRFLFRKIIISSLFYSIVIIPLYWLGIMGHPENKFFGLDKLLFGIITGSIVFLVSFFFHNFLVKKNQGKSFFPFQKVLIPILFLVILSLIFSKIC
ncbi:MAG: hypothetical protein QME57_03675 [Patescibacteria group bacterium]|nr:hypothetical protein [Patescibacteria group bacterium]